MFARKELLARIGVVATACLLFALQASQPAHAGAPDAVERAHDVISKNAKMIMAFVYPTVTFNATTGCEWADASRGWTITCKFAYTDPSNDRESRAIRFDLNDGGRITSIHDAGGESSFPAFATAGLFMGVYVGLLRDDLKEHPDRYSDVERAFVRALPDDPKPDVLLQWILNMAMR